MCSQNQQSSNHHWFLERNGTFFHLFYPYMHNFKSLDSIFYFFYKACNINNCSQCTRITLCKFSFYQYKAHLIKSKLIMTTINTYTNNICKYGCICKQARTSAFKKLCVPKDNSLPTTIDFQCEMTVFSISFILICITSKAWARIFFIKHVTLTIALSGRE